MNSTDTWFTPVLYRVSDNCRTIHDYDAPFILVVKEGREDHKSCFKIAQIRVCCSLTRAYKGDMYLFLRVKTLMGFNVV